MEASERTSFEDIIEKLEEVSQLFFHTNPAYGEVPRMFDVVLNSAIEKSNSKEESAKGEINDSQLLLSSSELSVQEVYKDQLSPAELSGKKTRSRRSFSLSEA